MSRYFVRLYATLSKDYVTEAKDYEEAIAQAKEAYQQGLIRFGLDDLVEEDIEFISDAFESVLELKLVDQDMYEVLPVPAHINTDKREYFYVGQEGA